MGTLSAEQWGCQAWLLLSKSSSRAYWGAGILQSNRRLLLEPAGDVMQLVGKGGQPIRCVPWPVSPVRAAWQQQAEWPRQRDFETLSGREVAGHGVDFLRLKKRAFVPSLLSIRTFWGLLCNWSSSWHEWQLHPRTRFIGLSQIIHESYWLDLCACNKLTGRFQMGGFYSEFSRTPKMTSL